MEGNVLKAAIKYRRSGHRQSSDSPAWGLGVDEAFLHHKQN